MSIIFKSHFPFKKLIYLIVVLFLISGCDKELTEIDEHKVMKKLSLQEEELINATNSLSLDILKSEFQHNQNENNVHGKRHGGRGRDSKRNRLFQ